MTDSTTTITVGDAFPAVSIEPITRATLALFAGASGDHNPIHLDSDVAHAAGLDDVFAQGMLSMAYLGRALTEWVPQSAIREFSSRFTAITPVHAQPTVSGTVIEIADVDGARRLRIALSVMLQDGTQSLAGEALVDI
ncbi:MaoC/PaaZ C-terminal domain-containing protein [Microbacterium gorillae]|uniref:MaoC/PaaZ C-terminal domain-containing protein n=1 Tax=Microbacterium gorillae TaxID=1231063 RepID=UPI00058EBC7D|nr:MaoC/PaaZ C-terminal domain-containing protein [Microbacterium gorillae]